MSDLFRGIFVPLLQGSTGNPLNQIPPGVEIPDEQDVEVWNGAGKMINSFTDGDNQYVIVRFNQDAPSDNIDYVYLYDDNEETDADV